MPTPRLPACNGTCSQEAAMQDGMSERPWLSGESGTWRDVLSPSSVMVWAEPHRRSTEPALRICARSCRTQRDRHQLRRWSSPQRGDGRERRQANPPRCSGSGTTAARVPQISLPVAHIHLPHRFKRSRNHSDFADRRDEVGVPVPPRDQVRMKMFRQTRPGRAAFIDADIDPLWMQ